MSDRCGGAWPAVAEDVERYLREDPIPPHHRQGCLWFFLVVGIGFLALCAYQAIWGAPRK